MAQTSSFELTSNIDKLITIYTDRYQGVHGNSVRDLVEKGCHATAYFRMTQVNQEVATEVKKNMFFSPHDSHYANDRVRKWQKDYDQKIPWWCGEENVMEDHLARLYNVRTALNKTGGCTFTESQKWSKSATARGTYLHEAMGKVFCKNACLDERAREEMVSIIPGRVYNPVCGLWGCTPDGFTVKDANSFIELYQELSKTDPEKEISPRLKDMITKKAGIPVYVHEIKTMQSTGVGITVQELNYLETVRDKKDDVVKFLTEKLKESKWYPVPKEDETDPPQKKRRKIVRKITPIVSSHLKGGLVFNRSTRSLPLKDVSEDIKAVEKQVFKHLSQEGDKISPHGINLLKNVGAGTIVVYNPFSASGDEVKFRLNFEKSPFVLGILSPALIQMMTQAATVRYMNQNAKYIYTCVMCRGGNGPARPAVQISFDVGFTKDLIDDYVSYAIQSFPCDTWRNARLVDPFHITATIDEVIAAESIPNNWFSEIFGEEMKQNKNQEVYSDDDEDDIFAPPTIKKRITHRPNSFFVPEIETSSDEEDNSSSIFLNRFCTTGKAHEMSDSE